MADWQLRARLARCLLEDAPAQAPFVTWEQLDQAPEWLARDRASLDTLALRCGSVLAAPVLSRWIAGPLRDLARTTLGAPWWRALRTAPAWPPLPDGLPDTLAASLNATGAEPALTAPTATTATTADAAARAERLACVLREAGAAVLLGTLAHGGLRHAASQRLGPPATWVMPQPAAMAVLQATLALQVQLQPQREPVT